jgi:hypothetical protein
MVLQKYLLSMEKESISKCSQTPRIIKYEFTSLTWYFYPVQNSPFQSLCNVTLVPPSAVSSSRNNNLESHAT